ncbi:MAG: DegV family protein [Dehalococcoidia bacterium]|jgi:DegV family protein with EDD domain
MAVKIVTDSTADLQPGVAVELGIKEVPLYVKFENDVYRDRVDISSDELFSRMERDPVMPVTLPPTPQDFADIYRAAAKDADAIVSIHISSKMSETCENAIRGRELAGVACPVEIIDSMWVSAALGMLVTDAARNAMAGKKYDDIVKSVKDSIPRIDYLGMFDNLDYLSRGGRIGKAKAFLGTVIGIKLLLTIGDGEFLPSDRVYGYNKALDRLRQFVVTAGRLKEVAVVHSDMPDDADLLAGRIKSILHIDPVPVNIVSLGPVLGVHVGPGTLGAVIQLKSLDQL